MTKIAFEIKNYKKIKEMNFDLDDYDAIIVSGPNRGGKSSLINGLFENLTAKNLSDEPLSRGEDKGEKSIIINDKNGDEIKIIHTFSKKEPRGTFYAIKDGQKISSVTKIRELIGDANSYTIDDFFRMCKDVPGRRKFIKEILMRSMTSEQIKKIEDIDIKINSKNGTLYTKRTELNAELKVLENTPGLSDEEKKILESKAEIEKSIKECETTISDFTSKSSTLSKIYNNIIAIENGSGWQTLSKDELKFKNDDANILFSTLIDSEKKALEYKDICFNGIAKLNETIKNTQTNLDSHKETLKSISNIEYKKEAFGDIDKKLEEQKEKITNINKEINDAIDEKSKVMASSNLPKGLVIHNESEFTYNGFNFNENEISESEGWLLLAELTIPIYDCKYFRMGNAAIYGKEALANLMSMAASNGKILALEKVVDDRTDVYVEGIVYDEETKKVEVMKECKIETKEDNSSNTKVEQERPGDRFLREQTEKLAKEKKIKEEIKDPLATTFKEEKEAFDDGNKIPDPENVSDKDIKKLNDLF